ncbi:cytochrome P450 87A3-like [Triticum urartu]|uniref:cytochrome P450 87A3-like n=1 Tax=Triticum urartu TaxID=4572 RepID=UPI00204306DF|nr:cytochrome P450 87A3-like [Triticum urartu]
MAGAGGDEEVGGGGGGGGRRRGWDGREREVWVGDRGIWEEVAAEEHNNIRKRRIDPDSEITWEEYKSMKFTSHVIHEALRLANIAPLMFRKATEEVHIKGYTLPKGSKIMVNPSSIHLDPTVYKGPGEFNPWRWKDTTEPAGGSSKEFMAFGGGLRLCVGA